MRASLMYPRPWAAGLLYAAILFLLAACGGGEKPSETLAEAQDDTALEHAVKHANPKYVCPMHPQIVRDEPGNCPICGMNLVPQEVGAGGGDMPEVSVGRHTAQALGVRTARVERDTLWKYIETVGYVSYDEDRVVHVHPRSNGWIEKIYVQAEGERVKRGQPLVEIYSPEIVAAQEEFLITLRANAATLTGKSRDSLIASAYRRLELLEIPPAVIERLRRTGEIQRTVPVLAPRDGVVTLLGVRDGMYVQPTLEMYTLADLSKVWVQVDVFEHQLDWVARGRPAEIKVAAVPGRTWEGEVDYIYPVLDPKTRTLRVRLRFDNADGQLKPNMFADVVIYGGPKRDVVAIPREAVIPGADGARVVKVLGDGRFQPVPVTLGMQSGERVEVLSGLEAGEEIVASGQFLIDSESNLQASLRRLSGTDDAPAPGQQP